MRVKGSTLLGWVDRIPLLPLSAAALFLGLAPFFPEPHLWEKIKLLAMGELTRIIDIFDLLMHGFLPLLLGIRLARLVKIESASDSSS